MADANTCEQCGVTNKPVRQSKRGKLFCFPCWDNENPQVEMKEESYTIETKLKKDESLPSGQIQKEGDKVRKYPGLRK